MNEKRPGWKKKWWIALGVLLLLLVAAVLAFPVFFAKSVRSVETVCMMNARNIGLACKLYAGDHDGRYPAQLSELVPKYLPEEKWLHSPFESRGPEYRFRYFGGTETDSPDTVLLLGKGPKDHWIVLHSDQSATVSRDPKWADYAPPIQNPKSKF